MTKPDLSKNQRAFLAAYRVSGSITKAAAAVPCERGLHYRWLQDTPAYTPAFFAAQTEVSDLLEEEAVRRAHEGVVNPIFYKGKPCGAVREYSDGLLQFLLKAFKPDKYRERGSLEVTGKDGGPITLEQKKLENLNDDELAALIVLAGKLTLPGTDGSGAVPPQAE